MTTASLSADLLVRKGRASPAGNQHNIAPLFKSVDYTTNRSKPAKKTICKSLRLTQRDNKRLRILAARMGISQQQVMETALQKLLDDAADPDGCICGNP